MRYTGTSESEWANDLSGFDVFDMRGGDDDVVTGPVSSLVFGGAGLDSLVGGAGDDTVLGGTGDDTLRAEGGDDRLFGGDGDDWLWGYEGRDRFFGGAGSDRIFMGERWEGGLATGADTAFGGTGDDYFMLRVTDDTAMTVIFGGAGTDMVYLNPGAEFTASRDLALPDNRAIIKGVEAWVLAPDPDTINCRFQTAWGDDILFDAAYNDSLSAGWGDDTVYGGRGGADTLMGQGGDDVLEANMGDQLFGDRGDDLLTTRSVTPEPGTGRLHGGLGDDTLASSSGLGEVLTGGAGHDQFVIDLTTAAGVADTVTDFQAGIDVIAIRGTAVLPRLDADPDPGAYFDEPWLLFDTDTGELWLDRDGGGAGAAILLLTLQGVTALSLSDFALVPVIPD